LRTVVSNQSLRHVLKLLGIFASQDAVAVDARFDGVSRACAMASLFHLRIHHVFSQQKVKSKISSAHGKAEVARKAQSLLI